MNGRNWRIAVMKEDEVFRVGQIWTDSLGERFKIIATQWMPGRKLNIMLDSQDREWTRDVYADNMYVSGFRREKL